MSRNSGRFAQACREVVTSREGRVMIFRHRKTALEKIKLYMEGKTDEQK